MQILKPHLYYYRNCWFARDSNDIIAAPMGNNTPQGAYNAWLRSVMRDVFQIY